MHDSTPGAAWRLHALTLHRALRGAGEPLAREVRFSVSESGALAREQYRLEVADGEVLLQGGSQAGLLYGIQRLLKLIAVHGAQAVPCLSLDESPREQVRGLGIDVGRRRWEPAVLLSLIEEMAWLGLNRLQLHLMEWNRFNVRLEDPRFSWLAAPEAYSVGELEAIIAYARARFIHVAVELNLPAHSTALIQHLPQLKFGPEDAVLNDGATWVGWSTEAWLADITQEDNRGLLGELVRQWAREIDADSYHLGGDEWFSEADLASSPAMHRAAARLSWQLNKEAKPADVVTDFMNEIARPLIDAGKQVEVWSWPGFFSGQDRAAKLDPAFTVIAWDETTESSLAVVKAGYQVIGSAEQMYYVTPPPHPARQPPRGQVCGLRCRGEQPAWIRWTSALCMGGLGGGGGGRVFSLVP